MADYLPSLLFLAAVFVAFGLFNRNRRDSCSDCSGDCDSTTCEKEI